MKINKVFIGEINLDKIDNSLYSDEFHENERNYKIALYEENKRVIDNIVDIVNKIRENNSNYPDVIRKVNIISIVETIVESIKSERRSSNFLFDVEAKYDKENNCVEIFFLEYEE